MKFLREFFFSIGRQILFMLFALLLLFFAFTLFNQNTLKNFSRAYSSQTSLIESIQMLKKDFSESGSYFSSYIRTGNRENLAQYNQMVFRAFEKISDLNEMLRNDDEIYLLKSIETAYRFYFSECCAASFLFNSKNHGENYNYLERFYYAQSVLSYLFKYCDTLLENVVEKNISLNENLHKKEQKLKFYNFIFVIMLLLSYFVFMVYVSQKLSAPLNQLAKASRSVAEGDFNQKIPEYRTANSVGVLIHAFNKMTADIKKTFEYKELLNQARFLAIQSQTNPHFLFNTLNSIARTITLGKTEQSLEMIDSLALLMRYSLSENDVPVTLQDELEISREYIRIQCLRFGERIKYEEKIDEGLLNLVFMPKFTLQPLIENAIIHGLEPKEEGGKIIVSAKIRGGRALIRIFDNGCGIEKKILAQISENNSASKRIGVSNTKKRLEFFEKSGGGVFEILSKKDCWTMALISLKIDER